MSQAGIINVIENNPNIPTQFDADTGSAVPLFNTLNIVGTGGITTSGSGNTITIDGSGIGGTLTLTGTTGGPLSPTLNNWNILGGSVVAGTTPVQVNGVVSTLTVNVQRSQAIASTNATNVGLAAFNSANFTVDGNGFVSLIGGGEAIDSIGVQTGTSPVVPTVAGLVTFNGSTVAAGTNPVRSNGTGANTYALEVQISQALAAADATKIGLSNFSSTDFAVAATGFVTLSATGAGKTITGNSGGALSPTANNWNILGTSTAAGTSPVNTSGSGSTLTVNIQTSQAIASTDATKIGLSNFNSAHFSVDANGFVSLTGGGEAIDSIGTQTGTNPITPTAGGLVTINGAVVAAGTNPIRSNGTGANTMALEVQISQALAAADATKIGLSNFSSTDFAVAATGFVTLSTTGAGKTITGDSGGALSPTANNWNVLGLSGSKTSGSGSTLTVKSPPFSQVGASATSSLNTGEFVTAAVTRTLPASAGLADGDLFIYVCTSASALIIQSVTAQKIRIGSLISAAAGTVTSTAIGDSLTLRFNATDGFFYAVSVIGTWLVA